MSSKGQDTTPLQKLLVNGFFQLGQKTDPVAVQRGMSVRASNGSAVGVVAAVVLNCLSQKITHILLGKLPPTAVYRLIPLSLFDRVDDESVWLRASPTKIETLPVRQPDS